MAERGQAIAVSIGNLSGRATTVWPSCNPQQAKGCKTLFRRPCKKSNANRRCGWCRSDGGASGDHNRGLSRRRFQHAVEPLIGRRQRWRSDQTARLLRPLLRCLATTKLRSWVCAQVIFTESLNETRPPGCPGVRAVLANLHTHVSKIPSRPLGTSWWHCLRKRTTAFFELGAFCPRRLDPPGATRGFHVLNADHLHRENSSTAALCSGSGAPAAASHSNVNATSSKPRVGPSR